MMVLARWIKHPFDTAVQCPGYWLIEAWRTRALAIAHRRDGRLIPMEVRPEPPRAMGNPRGPARSCLVPLPLAQRRGRALNPSSAIVVCRTKGRRISVAALQSDACS